MARIPVAQKVEWLITHDPELKQPVTARINVEWEGETVPFRIGEFWRSICPNFESEPIDLDARKGEKRPKVRHTLVLTDELKQHCLDKVPSIPRRIHELESKREAPDLTQTLNWLIEIDPELKLPMRSTTHMPWKGGMHPFQGGKLWNNIYKNFTPDGVGTKGQINTPLNAEQMAMCHEGLTGIPRRLEELEKTRAALKKNPNSGKRKGAEQKTSDGIEKLIKYDPKLQCKQIQKVVTENDDGTKEEWAPGAFWNNIKLNFVEGADPDKIIQKLTDAQKQRLREAIGEAIDRRVREYLTNPLSGANKK